MATLKITNMVRYFLQSAPMSRGDSRHQTEIRMNSPQTTAVNLASRVHPDDRADGEKLARGTMRFVAVNLNESPLGWLHARGKISDRQLVAGEKLRADYERAGLSARVTMRWDAPPPGGGHRGARAADAANGRIDAYDRFHGALSATGPGLADVCWRVICAGEPMPDAERAMGWPARSGRVVLTLALDRLAGYYGLS
jgi:Domain of unknown function (DUF6456)